MLFKFIASFTAGILIAGLLFMLQSYNYRAQAEIENLKLEARINELETQLQDAATRELDFSAVPTQADREALNFPDRPNENVSIDTILGTNQEGITGSTQVTPVFIESLQAASIANDTLIQQLAIDLPNAMEAVQERALTGNFVGFFELLNNAQVEVDETRELVTATNAAVRDLVIATNSSSAVNQSVKTAISKLESESLDYLETVVTLLDLLDQTLTGNIPDQAVLDEIQVVTADVNVRTETVADQYLNVVTLIAQ